MNLKPFCILSYQKEFTDHQFLTNVTIVGVGCTCLPFTSDSSHLPTGMFQELHEWLGRGGIRQNDDPKKTSVLHDCETANRNQNLYNLSEKFLKQYLPHHLRKIPY